MVVIFGLIYTAITQPHHINCYIFVVFFGLIYTVITRPHQINGSNFLINVEISWESEISIGIEV